MEERAKKEAQEAIETLQVMVDDLTERDVHLIRLYLEGAYMRGYMDGKVAGVELLK